MIMLSAQYRLSKISARENDEVLSDLFAVVWALRAGGFIEIVDVSVYALRQRALVINK